MSTLTSINPARPGNEVGSWSCHSPAEIDAIVRAASAAASEWALTPAVARGLALTGIADCLTSQANQIADLICLEVGKPITEARAEVARAVGILHYYAQIVLLPEGEVFPPSEPGALLFTRRRPLGVCALICPWNFPLAILTWKLAPCLVFGNGAVLKPSPHSTATALRVLEIFSAHLPTGLLAVVRGEGTEAESLIEHPLTAAVSFTGSAAVGGRVAAQAGGAGKPAQCEMGGLNPVLVLDDADAEETAEILAAAAMGYAGQKCTAPRRLIVAQGIYGDFREALVSAVEGLNVGEPNLETTQVGPLIDPGAATRVNEAIEGAGGKVIVGGGPIEGLPSTYIAPAIVELSSHAGPLVEGEVFGPVAALVRAKDSAEALRMANASDFGLVGAVHTKDLAQAMEVIEGLRTGLVRVNAPTTGLDYHVPFGGLGSSSFGPREQGLAAREFYTETSTVLVRA